MYKAFRIMVLFCFVVVTFSACLYFLNIVDAKLFAILSGSFGLAGTFFSIFANPPIQKENVAVAVDKVFEKYDEETFKELRNAKLEKKQIDDYIEHKSNERFLLKMRSFLEEEIIQRYNSSDLAKLIEELTLVESKLDELQIKYKAIQLPDRFKKILDDLNEGQKIDLYIDLVGTMPLLPFKNLMQFYMRLMYKLYKEKRKENIP